MKNIKYVGTSDYREISAADFEALEVEPGKEEAEGLRFASGEVKEVTDKVAEALTENISFVTEFLELSDADIKAEQEAAKEAQRERVAAHRAALLGGSGAASPTASDAETVASGAGAAVATGSSTKGGGAVGNGSSTAGSGS